MLFWKATDLFKACVRGDDEMVLQILNPKANSLDILKAALVELTDSPLHLAVVKNQLVVCEALIERCKDDPEHLRVLCEGLRKKRSRADSNSDVMTNLDFQLNITVYIIILNCALVHFVD